MKLGFAQYLLPGIIFQSVLIGGAYATGREIVEYGAKFGVLGVWSIAAIFVGFTVTSTVAYEFARVVGVYDYRRFVRELIGPLWPLFDLLFLVMVIVVIAVVGSASGSVVQQALGWPYWVGVGIVIAVVGVLIVLGRQAIERFKTVGTMALYCGYALFAGLVLSQRWAGVRGAFENQDTSFVDSATISTAVITGLLYVGYNLSGLPAVLFVLDRQTERRQVLWSGLITGVLAIVPFVLTYLAILGFYPDGEVLAAPVPWLVMLDTVGGGWLTVLYALVILWTLMETSTGMIHAVIDRVSVNLVESGRESLSPRQAAAITIVILLAASLLSRLGLIALVARGYTVMAYGFLLLFALPLLTVGVARIARSRAGIATPSS